MTTTPEHIASKRFPVTLRGYDPREVETFLAEIAGLYRDAANAGSARASSGVSFDHLGQEVSDILKTTTQTAEGIRKKAKQEAAALQRSAGDKANAVRAAAEQEVAARRNQTSREREQILAASRAEAERIESDARRVRSEMLDAATRRHQDLQRHERELRARIEAVEVVLRELRAGMDANRPPDNSDGTPADDVIDLTAGSHPRPRWEAAEVQPRPVFEPRSGTERG